MSALLRKKQIRSSSGHLRDPGLDSQHQLSPQHQHLGEGRRSIGIEDERYRRKMLSVPLYDSALMFAAFLLFFVVVILNLGSRIVLLKVKE